MEAYYDINLANEIDAMIKGAPMSKKTKKATIKTPVKELRKGETIEHYNAVLLEDIKSKMELVIEGMEGTRVSLKEDMSNLDRKLTGEIELLKGVAHRHSSGIDMLVVAQNSTSNNIKELALQTVENSQKIETLQGHVVENSKNIKELKEQVGQMEKNLSDKIDAIDTHIDDHEAKPAAIAHSSH